ncbi:hypothetical protein CW705_04465 [Candidatus Bathyarchaeota archaeon]|nr:MAG: hypothetical protein CW705_04465 [Candidatus Bathyarchaeota archaeon]RLE61945.1 MAG: hypothetical protein DRJ38_10530 [Thermoprotei archaeon]
MDSRKIAIIKIFLATTSLIAYGDFFPMIKITSPAVEASIDPILWLRISIFLVYVTMPIIALFLNNYIFYTLLTGVFLCRPIIELLEASWSLPFTVTVPLYIVAAILSLILAIEDASSKVCGEIFKLKWSQF